MSVLDSLFGDELGNENDGEIMSDDDQGAINDPDNPDANGADEGETKPIPVEPKKKTVRHPRLTLNANLLCGPRGIVDMENYFKDMKFKGKGHEREDLDAVMKRMQHWAHRMFPKYGFDDSLAAIENLGRKKQTQSYMNKYRMGLLEPEDLPAADDDQDNDGLVYDSNVMNQPLDPLDSMLDEQIAISRANASLNTSGVANLSMSEKNFDSIRDGGVSVPTTPVNTPSRPSPGLSEEMRAKIAANRLKALELRKARMAVAATNPEAGSSTAAEASVNVAQTES
ncbi:AAEL003648-PB [Aedes aegypti]|uniref:TIMELESS-interacting protein n=1 Tax=Aedes aegypti TaxID=7159 RepID=Q17EQ3_AEDAE|nr:AAEL003648-PA [Aedes aegypti]EAT45050.1 AAEL003648-PB [Aedes aegypti]